jgi:hypothetical protein
MAQVSHSTYISTQLSSYYPSFFKAKANTVTLLYIHIINTYNDASNDSTKYKTCSASTYPTSDTVAQNAKLLKGILFKLDKFRLMNDTDLRMQNITNDANKV